MAVHNNDINYLSTHHNCDNFLYSIQCLLGECQTIFDVGNAYVHYGKENQYAILWLDTKGNSCYKFNICDEDFITSTSKNENVLTSYFKNGIKIENNINEFFRKKASLKTNLSKAISDAQRHHEYATYFSNDNPSYGELNGSSFPQAGMPLAMNNPNMNQQQLDSDIINLSLNQLQYHEQTLSIFSNLLPVITKEEFMPSSRQAFYQVPNGSTHRNSYIPSEYRFSMVSNYSIPNSFIIKFIIAMTDGNMTQSTEIFKWLVGTFTTLEKAPYVLTLHSENDVFMKLFYEEIIKPLFNQDFCQIFTNNDLEKKSLSTNLHKKIITRFHNITSPIILDAPAKEFTKELLYNDNRTFNKKNISTLANILITSTTDYIPLIGKDIPNIVVKTASNLESLCKQNNIFTDHYAVAKLLKNDLYNFATILRHINAQKFRAIWGQQSFHTDNIDLLDGDVEALKIFNHLIRTQDITPFKLAIKTKKDETMIDELQEDLTINRINKKNMVHYFIILFGTAIYTPKGNRRLINDLRKVYSTTNEPFDNLQSHVRQGQAYYFL